MLDLKDIEEITFRKSNLGGYKAEEVDIFIDEVETYCKSLVKELNQKEAKIEILNKQLEKFQNDEDSIKNTLINAQKIADDTVKEAICKGEEILKKANFKAQDIVSNVQADIKNQKKELKNLKGNVSSFKEDLLNLYKQHLKLIDALPGEKNSEATEEVAEPKDSSIEENDDKTTSETKESKEKYKDLQFGDTYDFEKEEKENVESPIGLFKRKKSK